MDVAKGSGLPPGRRRKRFVGTIVVLLLAAAWLAGCQPDDNGPGIDIVNDLGRDVQIWYEIDGVESAQRAVSGETTIRPEKLPWKFRFGSSNSGSPSECTDKPIRARAGDEVVAVIPPSVCLGGRWIYLSEWSPE